MKQILLSTIVSGILLFLWSGASQMFPWGVPSTQTISTQSHTDSLSFQADNQQIFPPGTFITTDFETTMTDNISTLMTDNTFSWIITRPVDSYNMGEYFGLEFLTQLMVGCGLACLLWLTSTLDNRRRLLLVLLAGTLAVVSIYGQMMNWWGIPPLYALGAGVNLIVGWLIASWVSAQWILKPSA